MEGPLSVPPDRGTIIGRAVWKVRYVVVGGANRDQTQPGPPSRMPSNRTSTPRELARVSEGIFLSIYKSKEDTEPIQQYSITSIADCQLQLLAHRKQGPVLPTLVLNVLPDPVLDKARKRRSSRTAGFAVPKETGPTTLLFRPGDDLQNLEEWARFIQQLIRPHVPDRTPLSPLTPASPTFINPFAPRSREPSDMQQRPDSRNGSRPGFFLKNSSQSSSVRDRPVTFSDSPSLRSKRSDLSSQTSSMTQSHMGFHNYTTMVPADLPSPATTIGEYQGEFIEGWTSAQGRSSALSSPIRGRDSVSSQVPTPLPPIPDSNSPPPGPRETILDRAFQLRCIPGSEREVPGEEKLSSLARFDALMREMDEKRRQREAEEAKSRPQAAATRTSGSQPKSAFEEDDSDSDSDDDVDDSDEIVGEADPEDRFPSSSTQRALDYIAGSTQRHQLASRGHGIRSPPSYNHEALMALSSTGSSQMRPQTGYSRNRSRPGMTQRTHSQPHLATMLASSTPLETTRESEDGMGFSFAPGSPSAVHRSSIEQRHSASSAKRLSFSEFTRRLSSTSSLLLMQTNASGPASSRASNSDIDLQQPPQSPPQHLHHLHPRAGPPTPQQQHQPPQSPPPVGERERCGWRGSVGVFGGGDGGFV
ncbi:hypothetical protein C8A01DRAFT_43992 [Parachaetomium inaequale]|uniref:Uncharacterized protein n=1 Tax=Parachaetomium inaequale TaxID=2588326 RepID=A0AAN6PL57_9PEZI|nr:hypothetical protein C8A01DRAFT_43992 [Parachaetomium inaequale]